MAQIFDEIDDRISAWIKAQQMFFVGTAPLAKEGSVNLSPKGLDSLLIVDSKTLAYLDFGGSGAETIAHVRENGRIVIMMCAFSGPPKIFRFHGQGEIITPLDEGFEELNAQFTVPGVGVRSIVVVHVERVSDSCGYGVPNYEFAGDRRSAANAVEKTGVATIRDKQVLNNLESIDGLPALTEAEARAYVGVEKT